MYIKKVKVKGNPDEFGGRVISVRTKDKTFETPCRVPTSTEFRYKQEVPCDVPIESPISEIVSDFNTGELERFLEGNGPFKSRLDKARSNRIMMDYSGLLLYPQTPKAFELDLRARKEFVELQLMCGVDIITHPVRWSKRLEREVTSLVDEVEDRSGGSKEVMPYLDMDIEDKEVFRSMINTLAIIAETGAINSIGVIHRPRERFIQNYLTLWEMRDFDWWVHMSGVPRRRKEQTPAAEIHALQFFGIDTFSIKTSRAYGAYVPKDQLDLKATGKKRRTPPPYTVKRFDDASLGYLKENEWNDDYPKDKECQCPVCNGRTRQEFDDEYIIGLNGVENKRRLDQASRVHELFTSSVEFDISREYINDGEFADYVKTKRYFPVMDRRLG